MYSPESITAPIGKLDETPVAITVIALCYNHERFVADCLASIRSQSFQDFELIVTDDCSSDQSPQLIVDWLAVHYPDAKFIRHTKNTGLCKTLNEALALAQGTFISMIATDDTWEPEKLEKQHAAMVGQPPGVAVLYSNALQMDEAGGLLEKTFIAAHWSDKPIPSGSIFSELADGNFIPAMATLIRSSALQTVGGYDENLTYEDYDMWLRLAARFQIVYLPGEVARYRIVGTSLVRTLFVKPSANHSFSRFLIYEKWISSSMLSSHQRRIWGENLWVSAYSLYVHGDPRAGRCLWRSFFLTYKFRPLLLAIFNSFGASRNRIKRIASAFT